MGATWRSSFKWARANGCRWNEKTGSQAALGGHLEVVSKWAVADNGCCEWELTISARVLLQPKEATTCSPSGPGPTSKSTTPDESGMRARESSATAAAACDGCNLLIRCSVGQSCKWHHMMNVRKILGDAEHPHYSADMGAFEDLGRVVKSISTTPPALLLQHLMAILNITL